ncbi:FtsX-like permease family protein [Streptacidiphilus jiangxiensis]|uniref:Putative ABC transport system permease protein n=1 Tax=Streptacidiphilus jiangxiensis TaxID=235985 RepID=A0A1H7YC39_STRJI|nr:FtsX-like permease family protein [Streptacidiphilus jiangxiensis]SEM43772.1 putative ABC transport system permease protein [Streptacidiphilus jiangxiensis]
MRAVWQAARAAVRRRRLQTSVIALVVLVSTMTIVVALGLLDAASAPFDRAFARQQGAQLTATFDTARVDAAQLAATAHAAGVVASAGPFAQAVATLDRPVTINDAGPVTVVGRADPGGPVDRVNLWAGHWATGPGEVVFSSPPGIGGEGRRSALGAQITLSGVRFTVVGLASSVSRTADAWVAPDQMAALHPSSAQMLYRFAHAADDRETAGDLAAVTGSLPPGALTASQSYLSLEQRAEHTPSAFVPFLMVFGVLGLLVAALIVGNVVSGAVVSGFRHIGVLKALGFTPNQVVAVYLVMVSVPALVGCVLGTVLGDLAEQPLLRQIFNGVDGTELGDSVGLSPWVDLVALLGVPALVLLAALLPSLRARALPAARAISAGSAQRTGRALRIQRRLTGSPLPRSVSLGLGLPFARPGRSLLTLAAVVLGVTTVTFSTGLASTVTAFGTAAEGGGAYQVVVNAGRADVGMTPPTHTAAQIGPLLSGLPGARQVTPSAYVPVRLPGVAQGMNLLAYQGLSSDLGTLVVDGRWFDGPGEIVVSPGFLTLHAAAVGDRLTLATAGRTEQVTIVGETLTGDPDYVSTDWSTATALDPAVTPRQFLVKLAPGTDAAAYQRAVRAADPGLHPSGKDTVNAGAMTAVGSASVLSLLLGTVAALGVFNTVVLNARERRRDLGMLKSIGMTPRQVTAMMVTSMAALGLAGGAVGVPLGMLAHRLILPVTGQAGGIDFPASMREVWHPGNLALLALSGVALAALGALIPSRSAARVTIAKVLHNE